MVKNLPVMQETGVWSLSWEDPLEKAMGPHSSTLAWKIPWVEEPGRLQSMESLRVRHDWVTSLSLFTFMSWRRNGNPLQCSCLENPRDGGAWWAAVCGVTQSRTWLKRLSSSSSSLLEPPSKRHSIMSESLWLHGLYSSWNSPGQNTGVGSRSLLQGIFPTQGSNSGLPHCRWILYQLSHQGSPNKLSKPQSGY